MNIAAVKMKSKKWTPKFITLLAVCFLAGLGLLIIVTGAYDAGINRIDCPSTIEPGKTFTVTGEFSYSSTDPTYWAVELFKAEDIPIGPEDLELASLYIENPPGTGTQSFSLSANAPSSEMELDLVITLWVSVYNEDLGDWEPWNFVDERECSIDVSTIEIPPLVEEEEITEETEWPTLLLWIIIGIIFLIIILFGGWVIGGKIKGKPEAPCEKLRKALRAAKKDLEAKKIKYKKAKEKESAEAYGELAVAKLRVSRLKKRLEECERKVKKKGMISSATKKRDAARKTIKNLEAHIRNRGILVRKFKSLIKRLRMSDPLYIKRQWELYKFNTGGSSKFNSLYAPRLIEATLSETPGRSTEMLKVQFRAVRRIRKQILIDKVFPRLHDLGGILLAAVQAPSMKGPLIRQACAPLVLYIKDQIFNKFSSKFGQDLSKAKKFNLKQKRWLRTRIKETLNRLNNEIRVLAAESGKKKDALRRASKELRKAKKDC